MYGDGKGGGRIVGQLDAQGRCPVRCHVGYQRGGEALRCAAISLSHAIPFRLRLGIVRMEIPPVDDERPVMTDP